MLKIIKEKFIDDGGHYLKYEDASVEEVTKEEYYANRVGNSKLTLHYGTYTSY